MPRKEPHKPVVVVTGCSGLIGSNLVPQLATDYTVIGLDVEPLSGAAAKQVDWTPCDLTDSQSVSTALQKVRTRYGEKLASVIHLAAYYDFSGEPSPLYETLTVDGTARMLDQLQTMQVDQFVFSSSLLVMKSAELGETLTESSAVQAEWAYPKSKLAAESTMEQHRGDIPTVVLRIAGVYDQQCHSLPLSQQISRIYEKQFESYFFPGDSRKGQSFIHLEDLAACMRCVVDHRSELSNSEMFLIGEEDVMSYAELQDELGKLIHGKEWPTIRIPKAVAKAGAWVQDKMAGDEDEEPFIKPWMIDLADQNYPVNPQKAQRLLSWKPRHSLRDTLPEMIRRFREDRSAWYATNHVALPDELAAPSKG